MSTTEYIYVGTILAHVKTGCRKNKIISITDTLIKLEIAAKAENGKANSAIEKFLSRQFGKKVTILSGKTQPKKLLRIE